MRTILVNGHQVAVSTARPVSVPEGASESRWIGPIPDRVLEGDLEEDEGDAFYHAGGHTPAWGGYRATVRGEVVTAHATSTHLHPCLNEADEVVWYVLAPRGRKSGRAMSIALDAHRAGMTNREIRELGIFRAEVREGTAHWRAQVAHAKARIEEGIAFHDALTSDCGPGHLKAAARRKGVYDFYVPAEFRW